MKLSKTQLEVLRLMTGEWELGRTSTGFDTHYWIQKGGLGCGGEVKKLRFTTGFALYTKGLIETASSKFRYPTTNYRLTEKGRKAVEEALGKCPYCKFVGMAKGVKNTYHCPHCGLKVTWKSE